jgi:hypothetical protein
MNRHGWCRAPSARTTSVPAIIYDFKAIGGALRKQRVDDWWQPAKPDWKQAAEQAAEEKPADEDWYNPFGALWAGLVEQIQRNIAEYDR